jgi:flavin-dependent dehydrogenase
MRIAVVGARLAGSYASLLLSQIGHEVFLFDDSTVKEKPCGGGVTSKALLRMPWFRGNSLPHSEIRRMRMIAADGCAADLALRHPIHVFSRSALDCSLREASVRAGARFIPERAARCVQHRATWLVSTAKGEYEADFLVGADGATSTVRACTIGRFLAEELSLAVGFYLPGVYHPDTVITVFQPEGFRGYLWSFPRVDHSSVGILRWLPETRSAELVGRVAGFIAEHYPEAGSEKRFYAARIPCLGRQSLIGQRVCGTNWALLGDAAGFVDAITAEGIYFALRSAELLCEAIRRSVPVSYQSLWRQDFGAELERAALWRDRFFTGHFLFRAFTRRAVQATRRSRTVRVLTDRLICGHYTYERLRMHLILKTPLILVEAILDRLRSQSPHPVIARKP